MGVFSLNKSSCLRIDFKSTKVSIVLNKTKLPLSKLVKVTLPLLKFDADSFEQLTISNSIVFVIEFDRYTLESGKVFSLTDVQIHSCIMNEFNALGTLFLRGVDLVPYHLHPSFKVINLAPIKNSAGIPETLGDFMNRTNIENPTFRIHYSSLGNAELIECSLRKFNFEYSNSKITNVFITGGTLPKKINMSKNGTKKKRLEKNY